jgi:hypothetical protein
MMNFNALGAFRTDAMQSPERVFNGVSAMTFFTSPASEERE